MKYTIPDDVYRGVAVEQAIQTLLDNDVHPDVYLRRYGKRYEQDAIATRRDEQREPELDDDIR